MRRSYVKLLLIGFLAVVVVAIVMVWQPRSEPPRDAIRVVETAGGDDASDRRLPAPSEKAPATTDPLAAVFAAASPEIRQLHDQVAREDHDENTARTEQRLTSAIPAGLSVAARGEVRQVGCSVALCEIVGSVSDAPAVVQQDLANPLWLDTLPRLGYTPGPSTVATDNGRTTFVIYLIRKR